MNWIPTKERLPEKDTRVIVTEYDKKDDAYYVYVANLYMSNVCGRMQWMDDDGCTCELESVIAWMPLPEPYKEKS